MEVQKKVCLILVLTVSMSFFACQSAPPPVTEKPAPVKEKPVQPQPVKKVEPVKPVEPPKKAASPKTVLKDTYIFHFRANSVYMEPQDMKRLTAVVKEFKAAASSVAFVIEGHAASVQLPKGEKKLSVQRVQRIAEELKKNGIAADRIKTVAYSSTRPVVPNNSKKNRAKNRRVEIRIVNQ